MEERATPANSRKGMRPSGENSGDASAINEVGNDGWCVAENLGDVRSELKGRGQELFINDHAGERRHAVERWAVEVEQPRDASRAFDREGHAEKIEREKRESMQ